MNKLITKMKNTIQREHKQASLFVPGKSILYEVKKILFIIVTLICVNYSCIDDKGNYDYVDASALLPDGIKDFLYGPDAGEYYDVTQGDSLIVIPEIYTLVNGDTVKVTDDTKYSYVWYAYRSDIPVQNGRDTLAYTRNLKVEANMAVGYYRLYLQVKNASHDIFVTNWAQLSVTATPLSSGRYVLKTIDGKSDFDYISRAGGSPMYENVLYSAGLDMVSGNPIMISYTNFHWHAFENEDGTTTLSRIPAYYVMTDENLLTYQGSNLMLLKDYEEQFYQFPERDTAPQQLLISSTDTYFIHGNKVYALYGMAQSYGKFGLPQLLPEGTADYFLHPDLMIGYLGILVFDEQSSTFFNTNTLMTSLRNFTKDGSVVASAITDFKMIRMLQRYRASNTTTGYALVENLAETAETKYSILNLTLPRYITENPVGDTIAVPDISKLPSATVMAAPATASCIYFANDDNVLKAFSLTTMSDRIMYTFGSNEKVAYIWNNTAGRADGATSNTDYIEVLTNDVSANKWKLYLFEVINSTIEINTDPKYVYSGSGRAVHIMYR